MQREGTPKRIGKSGFTLIELLVSITIIGLLTSIAVANYTMSQRRSRDSVRKAGVQTTATAIESYYSVKQRFPGKYNVSTLEQTSPYLNCEQSEHVGGIQYFTYYYYPLDINGSGQTLACHKRPAQNDSSNGKVTFTPDDYRPFPSWIPGLGEYLTSIPIEPRFQADANGGYSDPLRRTVNTVTNTTRTLTYRKLSNGYALYAKLESSDEDGKRSMRNLTTDPRLPSTYETELIASPPEDIHLIRK